MAEQVVTTQQILEALRASYPRDRGWATVTEVVSADKKRRADFMAWNTWDGKVHIAEIKMSRGDWNLERSTPGKAGAFASECDAFWLATTGDVVRAGEVPEPWGLFLVDPNGVSKAPGRRLGGSPSHELATAFLRRVLSEDWLREREVAAYDSGRLHGIRETKASNPGGTYTKKDLENARREGYNERIRHERTGARKQEGKPA